MTINNGSQSQVSKGGSSGCVFITPLSGNMPNTSQQLIRPTLMLQNTSLSLAKVLVKAVSKDGLKDSGKMLIICDLDITSILSCKDLKQAIRRQFSDDIIDDNFDVGYLEGSSVIRIRNGHDLEEVWSCIRNPGSKCLYCCVRG